MASAESVSSLNQKRSLRRAMNERRAQLSEADKRRDARAACDRLLDLPEMAEVTRRAGCLAGFVSVKAEIDPAAALDEARRRGARVAYPRVTDDRHPRLCFHVADSADLRAGRFGIPEPPATSAEVPLGDIDLMLVPGVAFDGAGGRLGLGGGYYDEILAAVRASGARRPRCVGLGYDFQIVDACPAEPHDQPVDCVVTEARVLRRDEDKDEGDDDDSDGRRDGGAESAR
jgi:5-formyltetrahydrofolate cyclo-ligase